MSFSIDDPPGEEGLPKKESFFDLSHVCLCKNMTIIAKYCRIAGFSPLRKENQYANYR